MAECIICLQQLRPPVRVLPCCHSYCMDCLRQLRYHCGIYNFEDGTVSVNCPNCRQEARLDKGKISTLPTNFALNKLLETSAVASVTTVSDENSRSVSCNQQTVPLVNNELDETSSAFYARIQDLWQNASSRDESGTPNETSTSTLYIETPLLSEEEIMLSTSVVTEDCFSSSSDCLVDMELSLGSDLKLSMGEPATEESFRLPLSYSDAALSYRLSNQKINLHDYNAHFEEAPCVTEVVTTSELDESSSCESIVSSVHSKSEPNFGNSTSCCSDTNCETCHDVKHTPVKSVSSRFTDFVTTTVESFTAKSMSTSSD